MGGDKSSEKSTGEVFTRPEVVAHMLHEIERTGHFRKWGCKRILEPSCGEGAFVIPVVEKLILEKPDWRDSGLDHFLTACDISPCNIETTRRATEKLLTDAHCPLEVAKRLVGRWFVCGDFLLLNFDNDFDVVVGNPPYIRFDEIDAVQQIEYRRRYVTFSERCDIYVPFIERSLSLLSPSGVFSFICSNRFAKSSYGRRLRSFIAHDFHVVLYLNMEHAQPFVEEVSAYPAILVIDRHRNQETLATTIDVSSQEVLRSVRSDAKNCHLSRFTSWYSGEEPWLTTDADERNLAISVQTTYPTIERSAFGTRIGIGVASGADDIFVDAHKAAGIEKKCLLPLVTAAEIQEGRIKWTDRYILNPYDPDDDESMLDLGAYPQTAKYLNEHADRLKSRYCARQHPQSWYRTLDRIKYAVLTKPKLLLPDIQRGGNVALDEKGQYYPHHNVYWITSETWNMRALCVIMRSRFVTDQIRRVSVQMRGGSIRYQAQNLRSIHIPSWNSLSDFDVSELAGLYPSSDMELVDRTVDRILSRVRTHCEPRMTQLLLAVERKKVKLSAKQKDKGLKGRTYTAKRKTKRH